MKISLFFLATALSGVMAAPAEQGTDADVEARASCWNKSSCSMSWAGKCEDYCSPYEFSHMAKDDCGIFEKRCCCKT